jgi:dipeptidyl aminopeptidase/acylaminoacyl peptidase
MSGEERRIPLGLDDVNGRMHRDGRTMLLRGRRLNGAVMDVVRVDLPTGQVTPVQDEATLALFEDALVRNRQFSPDLSIKYVQRLRGEEYEIVAQEGASGAERVLYRSVDRTTQLFAEGGPDGHLVLSPDGTLLAFVPHYHVRAPTPEEYNALLVLPVSGGDARIVHTGWVDGRSIQWTSDSRTLVFLSWADADGGARGVRKVNADGSGDALLLTWPGGIGEPRLAPDDRRIVFRSRADPETRFDELWVLDNLQEGRPGEQSGGAW